MASTPEPKEDFAPDDVQPVEEEEPAAAEGSSPNVTEFFEPGAALDAILHAAPSPPSTDRDPDVPTTGGKIGQALLLTPELLQKTLDLIASRVSPESPLPANLRGSIEHQLSLLRQKRDELHRKIEEVEAEKRGGEEQLGKDQEVLTKAARDWEEAVGNIQVKIATDRFLRERDKVARLSKKTGPRGWWRRWRYNSAAGDIPSAFRHRSALPQFRKGTVFVTGVRYLEGSAGALLRKSLDKGRGDLKRYHEEKAVLERKIESIETFFRETAVLEKSAKR